MAAYTSLVRGKLHDLHHQEKTIPMVTAQRVFSNEAQTAAAAATNGDSTAAACSLYNRSGSGTVAHPRYT